MTQPDEKRENSPAGETSESDSSRTRTRTRTRRRDAASSSETAKDTKSNGSGSSSTSAKDDGADPSKGERSSSRSRRSRSRGGSDASTADASPEKSSDGAASGEDGGSSKSDARSKRDASSKSDARSKSGAKSRDGAKSKDSDSGSDEGDAKDSSGGSKRSGDDEESGSSSNRRRRGRRGRRGRGRGRSGGDGGSDKPTAKDTSSEKSSKDSSSKKGEGGDDAVKDAIQKGGTRMAAKRGGSRGGGGSRGSSRGGGGNRGGGRHQRPTGVSEEVRRAILDGPPRTMLVTSTEERTQIAVLEDRTVVEHHVTRKQDVTYVGNIYMARVQNVLPGMEAAFLDIGKGRNGVLYAGEVLYDELDLEEGIENPRIEDALKQGQKVLVQVTKDPMGSKGPRLTMHLSLAGRYMVLAPNSDLFGISRKLTDKERDRLRRIVKKVKPDHHGVIVRTAAENATEDQLTADLERLLKKWAKAEKKAANAKALTPVYEEPPLVVKVIRDNFGPEFERCVVDSPELYVQVCDYLEEVAPELLAKVELYGQKKKPVEPETKDADEATGDDATAPAAEADPSSDEGEAADAKDESATSEDASGAEATPEAEAKAGDAEAKAEDSDSDDDHAERELPEVDTTNLAPLFDSYHVNEQLRKAMGRKVWLPSGGYLIIESTEAMKVIDVNTGKFTGDAKSNLEEVVLKTNLEAAEEIVRQLRLRDLGGIIVIDFIDMLLKTNQDQVVRKLKRELLRDRTKTRVSEVSKLGLVQMTRKNVSQGLVEAFSHKCETCEGHGYVNELDG